MSHLPAWSRSSPAVVEISADPRTVFDFVTEPRTYPDWLVGAQDMRAVDDDWPQPGSQFHHRVGVGPLHIDDTTTVISVDRPDEFVLRASIGVLGAAVVRFSLDGAMPTRLTLEERPESGLIRLLGTAWGRLLLRPTIWGRNRVALQKLKTLIEAGTRVSPTP